MLLLVFFTFLLFFEKKAGKLRILLTFMLSDYFVLQFYYYAPQYQVQDQ